MGNMDLYNSWRKPDKTALKAISAGRLKGMTDINPMWRYRVLTETFGPIGTGWKFETVRSWVEDHGDLGAAVFVVVNLYYKTESGWSEPVEGIGGSKTVSLESKGLFLDDEAYKKATTDAIGTACKYLGLAADVYYAADTMSKYETEPTQYQAEQKPVTPITDEHIAKLRKVLKFYKIPEGVMAGRYDKQRIEDLTDAQFSDFEQNGGAFVNSYLENHPELRSGNENQNNG